MKKINKLNIIKVILLIAILSLFFFNCKYDPPNRYVYKIPEKRNDGLEVGSLADVNIDITLIVKAMDSILGGRFKEVHSILIFKDNKLVFEEYFPFHYIKGDSHCLVLFGIKRKHKKQVIIVSETLLCS